jgi:signal transduction histidine kinase
MNLRSDFISPYAAALRSHMLDAGEAGLHQAYGLGRLALGEGLGVVDLVNLHHQVLSEVMLGLESKDRDWIKPATEFLAEILSSYEMTLRAYRESNERLSKAVTELRETNAALKATHEKLAAETAERRHAQAVLQQSQRLQTVGQLAGGIAHHFNNLLTVVLGNLELISFQVENDASISRFLNNAWRGAKRAADLTTQLLAFSRQKTLAPQVVHPSEKLADLASLLSSSLRSHIVVQTDIPKGLWPLELDPAQLEHAMLNMGLNARDAMAKGGLLRISATNRHIADAELGLHGDYVVIEVRDNGAGISPEVLPYVFDPFFTTKEVGTGTGLGLSQVYAFARQSGGMVEAESAPGEGATFRLYLPAAGAGEGSRQ